MSAPRTRDAALVLIFVTVRGGAHHLRVRTDLSFDERACFAAHRGERPGRAAGAIACLYSLSSIAGPPLMTQVFGYFSSPAAPVHFPGAAFLTAAALTVGSAALLVRALRHAPERGAAHAAQAAREA